MKFIAYFLPQFYTTPENDKFWGKGFTDWTSVRSAKPLFYGHKQPKNPGELGYYDLSIPSTLKRLSEVSLKFGIDGFGYWHYWFGNGYKALEKVQEMHLADNSIKQNFFFAWANINWTKSWIGDDRTVIYKQVYSEQSAKDHFNYIKPFIEDSRYIKYKYKPLFQVINPDSIGAKNHIRILENLAKDSFGKGFHWIFPATRNIEGIEDIEDIEFSLVGYPPGDVTVHDLFFRFKKILQTKGLLKKPIIFSENNYLNCYSKSITHEIQKEGSYFPCILSGWDNTPRYNKKGFLINGKISSLLKGQYNILLKKYNKNNMPDIVFIKSWNEWAENNILEPFMCNEEYEFPAEYVLKMKNIIKDY